MGWFSTFHVKQHFWQIKLNMTSIEFMIFAEMNYKGTRIKGVKPSPITHEWDHSSIFENMKRMIGKDWWFWLLPTIPSIMDDENGYRFKVNKQNQQKIKQWQQQVKLKQKEIDKMDKIAA